jgi:hypothetical protein
MGFSLTFCTDISYVRNNSIIQSSRFNGHTFNASVVNGNTLRFIAYSESNKVHGSDGKLFSFKLKPTSVLRNYNLNISNQLFRMLLWVI